MTARGVIFACLAVLLLHQSCLADIATDGTVGPKGALKGPDFKIPHTRGRIKGGNLFHSFDRFSIDQNQSATFTGPSGLDNVISRVTGGERSTINGKLASEIPNADFWLINPAGVFFGPRASIDVPAAFHVSTADHIGFADGSSFSALDAEGSTLSVAPPEAFGFLDPPRVGIEVKGSELSVSEGAALSIVGGDIAMDGALVTAPAGTIHMASVASPGEVAAADMATSAASLGTIDIANLSWLATNGNGGGTIRIRGGEIIVDNSDVVSINTGSEDALGDIDVQSGSIQVIGGFVGTQAEGSGDAGAIMMSANAIDITSGGVVTSQSIGSGDAGNLTVSARDRVTISGGGLVTNSEPIVGPDGKFVVAPDLLGAGGTIEIDVRILELSGGGTIESKTSGIKEAGDLTIKARDTFTVSGVGTAIASQTRLGGGAGGNINIDVGSLELSGGGQIRAVTLGTGQAGNVAVNVRETITVSGVGSAIGSEMLFGDDAGGSIEIDVGSLELRGGGQILAVTRGTAMAGNLTVKARDRITLSGEGASGFSSGLFTNSEPVVGPAGEYLLDPDRHGSAGQLFVAANQLAISNDAVIASNTLGGGAGGTIEIDVGSLVLSTGGAIEAVTSGSGRAGNLMVNARDSIRISGRNSEGFPSGLLTNSQEGAGPDGRAMVAPDLLGPAGQLFVSTDRLFISDGAGIASNTFGSGAGGTIEIDVGRLELRDGGQIEAVTEGAGPGGTIRIESPHIMIEDRGEINTVSEDMGDAGNIFLSQVEELSLADGRITTEALNSDGGRIDIRVSDKIHLNDSAITTTVSGGSGNAGNIFIDPTFLILENSRIVANAEAGAGGSIAIQAGHIIVNPDSVIDASSRLGISGRITIDGDARDLTSDLEFETPDFADPSSLIAESCASQSGKPRSSLVRGARDGPPSDPGGPLSPTLIADKLPDEVAEQAERPSSQNRPVLLATLRAKVDANVTARNCMN